MKNLKTKIFLDSAFPQETKDVKELLGFLDGQTTNPSLMVKNLLSENSKQKISNEDLWKKYKEIVIEISKVLGDKSISIEVYADSETKAEEMIERGRELFTWIPHAHIKLPIISEGLKAAEILVNEGVRVNTLGTYTVAKSAMEHNVDTFILISTDKAVRPTNVMGASKRFAELVLQGLATQTEKTKFSMVRFGNVLGSSGSVVPLFREQIKQGGPVTVTHQDIIRYFMTIPEAVQLVIQAGAMGTLGKGGDVFVLDMGEPVKISDLASKMIHLMGFTVKDENTPDGDIEIEYSGLRPGEKLYEELLIGENPIGTSHPRIMRAEEESYSWEEIQIYLDRLEQAIGRLSCEEVRQLLIEVVKGYQPSGEIEDIIWKERLNKSNSAPVVELNNYQSKQDN